MRAVLAAKEKSDTGGITLLAKPQGALGSILRDCVKSKKNTPAALREAEIAAHI